MGMQKLLIADGTEAFRLALADHLRGAYVIRLSDEGHNTLEQLCTYQPDVLVLDLMLPGLDGISILQLAAEAGIHPVVLATTRYVSDYVLDAADRLGINYIMMKPCDIRATVARIADLTQHKTNACASDPKSDIAKLLMTLGIPTKLRGYIYLQEAIMEAMRDPHQQITKTLYPAVADLTGSSPVQVERSIRSAITSAWKTRDEQLWRLYFQSDCSGNVPKPTNGAFITSLASRLSASNEASKQ